MLVDKRGRSEAVVACIEDIDLLIVIHEKRYHGVRVAVLDEDELAVRIRTRVRDLDERMQVVQEHRVLVLLREIVAVVQRVRHLAGIRIAHGQLVRRIFVQRDCVARHRAVMELREDRAVEVRRHAGLLKVCLRDRSNAGGAAVGLIIDVGPVGRPVVVRMVVEAGRRRSIAAGIPRARHRLCAVRIARGPGAVAVFLRRRGLQCAPGVDLLHVRQRRVDLVHGVDLPKDTPVRCAVRELRVISADGGRHEHHTDVFFRAGRDGVLQLLELRDDLFLLLRRLVGFDVVAVLREVDVVDLLPAGQHLILRLQGHEGIPEREVVGEVGLDAAHVGAVLQGGEAVDRPAREGTVLVL